MGSWNRWVTLLAIATSAAWPGCASHSPRDVPDDQDLSLRIEWPESPDAGNDMPRGGESRPPASAAQSAAHPLAKAAAAASAIGDRFTGAFKTAAHKVSDATRIKPKMVPAEDSLKLSNMPDHVGPLLYLRGAAFSESKGDLSQAQRQYEKALELAPRNIVTLIAYARFRDRIGDSKQALDVYQRARSLAPNNAIVWNDLAMCHARRGEVDHALAAEEQAVSLQPDNGRYRNNLAAILVQAKRPDDAVRELEKVYPPAVACHNVACLLLRLRNPAVAVEYLQRAVALDPSLQRAQMLLVRLDRDRAANPSEPRAEAWDASGSPSMPSAGPQRRQESNDASDPRNVPWQPEPRDATYGSFRRSRREAAAPKRFPRVF